jgi:hypothetical protein
LANTSFELKYNFATSHLYISSQDLPKTANFKMIDIWLFFASNVLVITMGFHTYLSCMVDKAKRQMENRDWGSHSIFRRNRNNFKLQGDAGARAEIRNEVGALGLNSGPEAAGVDLGERLTAMAESSASNEQVVSQL